MAWGPGGEATVLGTRKTLLELLSLTTSDAAKRPLQQLTVKANPSNVGTIYIGGVTVTALANRHYLLGPGDSYTWGPFPGGAVRLDALYVIGPGTGEVIHIASIRE